MKILLLTSSSNPLATGCLQNLIRQAGFEVRVIFLLYKGKRGTRLQDIRNNIRRSGTSFLALKALDMMSLRLRWLLLKTGIPIPPAYPLEIVVREKVFLETVSDINAPPSIASMRNFGPDILVTAGFGQILKKEAVEVASIASINLHPSLLPRYPGSNPFREILRSKDATAGVTVHRLSEVVDGGEILGQASYPVPKHVGEWTLRKLAAKAGAELLMETIQKLQESP